MPVMATAPAARGNGNLVDMGSSVVSSGVTSSGWVGSGSMVEKGVLPPPLLPPQAVRNSANAAAIHVICLMGCLPLHRPGWCRAGRQTVVREERLPRIPARSGVAFRRRPGIGRSDDVFGDGGSVVELSTLV